MPYTTSFGGCTFSYRVRGAGEPVVFIQGVGLNGDGWSPQTDELSSHFRCVSFDNRGMAASQPAAVKITVDQMAADTLAVMDAAGIQAAHLVGHSLGGVVAQRLALTARDRVKSLALLCTSSRGADATRPSLPMIWAGLRSRIGTRRSRARAFLEIIMPAEYLATQDRDALAEKLAPVFGHSLADTPPVVMPQLNALKRFDASGRLALLEGIPTLVLSAQHDIIFPPACGKKLAGQIPGAKYLEIGDAAHGVPIHLPETVNRILLEHLSAAS